MTTQLHIDFPKVAEIGLRGVRRAAAFVAMGQKAWSDESITSAVVKAPYSFQMLPDPLPKELADEVRAAFCVWVIGSTITEMVQALSLFADECFQLAALTPCHNKKVTQEALDKIKKCRDDTNLHSKLMMLATEFGVKFGLLEHTDGWTRARNSLAHNHGIVRKRDFSPGVKALRVSWRRHEFSLDGKKIEDIIGLKVEKGGLLGFSLGRGDRDFKLGEQIDLSEQEILNICLTAYLQIGSSVQELEKFVRTFIGEPAKPDAPATS